MTVHLSAKDRRDVERCHVQRQRLRVHLDPADDVAICRSTGVRHLCQPSLQPVAQILYATQAVHQAFASLRLRFKMPAKFG